MPVVDPRAAGQQSQPIGQPGFEPIEPEGRIAGGGELDRQRHAVEGLTDGGDALRVVGSHRTPPGLRPAEEQLDCVTRATAVHVDGQPGHQEHPLERNQQPGPACREHGQPGTAGEQPLQQDHHAIQQVFAVVQDVSRSASQLKTLSVAELP